MSQPKQPDILLIRYSVILQPDGNLVSKVDNIEPDEFVKSAHGVDPTWSDAVIISTAMKYLLGQLKALDVDFEKYLLAL